MANNQKKAIRILLVEDVKTDAEMVQRVLQTSEQFSEVSWSPDPEEALARILEAPSSFDIVITDYSMPSLNGLELCQELINKKVPLPLVILTGTGNESLAVQALKAGVDDYIIKDVEGGYLKLLPVVIPEVINNYQNRLACKKAEEEKEKLIVELQEALAEVKKLSGLLPICASCKKIRDDKGYWNQIEIYIEQHSDALFSHGICPDCLKSLYPGLYQKMKEEGKI